MVIDESEEEQMRTREMNGDQYTISSDFVTRVRRRLEERRRRDMLGRLSSPLASIFKVPPCLTTINYMKNTKPEIFSIGPYHRGQDHLVEFEEYKWFFLVKFLGRSEKSLTCHLLELEGLEARARRCYSGNVAMSSEDFIEMMLLDGCFLIEVLCHLGRDEVDHADPVFSRPWFISILLRDIVKLENQLPLFVLTSFFPKSKSNSEETFIKLILEFFSISWSGPTLSYQPHFLKSKHLLELFYLSLLPSCSVISIAEQERYRTSRHSIQCVRNLRRSGIKFKPREAQSLLDIKYEKQVLQIPSITINDITSTVLINCVALEQCQEYNIKYFSNYVSFMYCLINQPGDVALLGLDGIITNFSQDDQYVADLFNILGENTILNIKESYLSKVLQDIEAYYCSYWARIVGDYFSNPWSIISVIAAFILLLLTMLQTVMSILSYMHG